MKGEKHGGSGGVPSIIDLGPGEKITEMHARVGIYLNQIFFNQAKAQWIQSEMNSLKKYKDCVCYG